ncbi:PREDICTED: uncharacterized protein LOC109157031 [Ipomoea nil]|uniref:uncharacterized protein LOC109157031 n=1 Tax=Ipomoea nil TaxID=35883 RepID=UPI000900CCEB|nr:PREDICTED: uncharacterized protein LOC109157031 [Ipomoea nil]
MSANSSERTVTTTTPPSQTTGNSLNAAHHFVSIKLNNRNFLFWRTQIIPFLRGQGLLGYIDGSHLCPPTTLPVTAQPGNSGTTAAGSMVANPAHAAWVQQDQSILSLLISSLFDEVMPLAVGREMSRDVWLSINESLASSTRARCLNLLGQFQTLRQCNMSASEYLGKAKMLVEALSLAGHRLSLDEQVLYVLRGLRPEFRAMASALTVTGTPMTLSQLGDLLQAQDFIQGDEFAMDQSVNTAPVAMYAGRGGQSSGGSGRGGRQNSNNRSRGRGGRQSGGRGRGSPRCQICKSHGHTAIFCNKRYTEPPSHAHMTVVGTPSADTARRKPGFPTPAPPLTPSRNMLRSIITSLGTRSHPGISLRF